jgi:flagellar M-ring protein FliF
MDVVQRYLRQALAIWGALGRSQQIALGVLAAAGLGLLFVLSTISRTPDTAVAFANLSDDDASAVVAKLKEAKIPYELGERGTIRVPSALVNEVKVMMAGQGLGGKPATGSGFELFNQPAFGITEFAQKVNYQRALEAELARSIGRMDSVESVRVHLDRKSVV